MTDATDPLLRDPLVQYLGILRAQHADYHPLEADEYVALRKPYLAASHAIADLVVAAVDSMGAEEGLEEVVGLLRGMLEPITGATLTDGGPIAEAVDFVAATMREQHPAPPEARFTAGLAGTYGIVTDRQTGKAAAFASEAAAIDVARQLESGKWLPASFIWRDAA